MTPIPEPLRAAILQGLFFSLCAGLALSTVWGLWLLLAPGGARRFAARADQWVTTEPWFERLNRPLDTTRLFYRHHRAAGLLIVLGAGYALVRWYASYERASLLRMLDRRWISAGLDWLVPAFESIFVAFNAAILVFGIVVAFRPSLLKAPERWANRWVQVGSHRVLDRRFDPLAPAVDSQPRVLGLLVAGVCGYLLWRLLPLY